MDHRTIVSFFTCQLVWVNRYIARTRNMPHVAARTASRDRDTGRYQSHRPEQTLLYQIVDEYYPAFAALMAEQGKELPGYVGF